MKRILCIVFCGVATTFSVLWTIIYAVSRVKKNLPHSINVIIAINLLFILASIIIGFCVIKVSIDQWFDNGGSDILDMKDRVLIWIELVISIICCGLFICTIVQNNINGIAVTEIDNIKLRMLLLIMANSYVAYAFFQSFQVIKNG